MEQFENTTVLENQTENMAEIATINFERWNQALLSKNPEAVSQLYAPEATFLPTVSHDFKKGPGEATEYFIDFLKKNPGGKIIEEVTQTLSQDCYLHSGMYNFEVGPDEDRQIMEARFSFVWKKNKDGQWEIIHHHSSVKPKQE